MTPGTIDEANAILIRKGFKPSHLGVFSAPLAGKALLKGPRILSPLADTEETVFRAVRDCVPTAEELGTRTLTPHELRACLERAS